MPAKTTPAEAAAEAVIDWMAEQHLIKRADIEGCEFLAITEIIQEHIAKANSKAVEGTYHEAWMKGALAFAVPGVTVQEAAWYQHWLASNAFAALREAGVAGMEGEGNSNEK